jgi:hypothetical protein
MKFTNFLKKTIAGIPVWFLLSVAVALGAVYTYTGVVSVQAKEPFPTILVTPTSVNLFPGESRLITISIKNIAPVTYGITVNTSITEPCSIEFNSVDGTITHIEENKFNITQGWGYIKYNLALPADAEGDATCSLDISIERGAPFS